MARRTRAYHHHVYVVEFAIDVLREPRFLRANPDYMHRRPCVYVGMTGLSPDERFANHKQGIKSSALAERFGIRLLPELYAHLNPMPFEAAVQMEKDLTEDLRRAGYTVVGGH